MFCRVMGALGEHLPKNSLAGGLGPIHSFEAHFCASKVMKFCDEKEGYGYFETLLIKSLY